MTLILIFIYLTGYAAPAAPTPVAPAPTTSAAPTPAPSFLRCEYLLNPIGIDAPHPRLTWRLTDTRNGARQTAYAISIGTDSAGLNQGKGILWASGRQASADQRVVYSGSPLQPFTRYYWMVRVWDQDGKPVGPGPIASFETGTMGVWKGAWISDTRNIRLLPAPYFRHPFHLEKTIRQARAYIAVAGLYELSINGQKVGDHRLDPMYTRFDRRNLYVTYDITSLLQQGDNAVGVLLGNGWYNLSSTAVWYFDQAPWRARPAFCLDLRITYTDGSVETISSGKNWKTSLSPIIFNSIYTGEHTDARKEQPGWNTAAFNDSAWKEVMLRSAPSTLIVTQALPPIRDVDTIAPVAVHPISDTDWVFDLGRNIAGTSRITLRGEGGTTLRLIHGERLNSDGTVDQSNISVHYRPTDDKDPFQTDIYTLSGKGEESFSPKFNYKGFQYVEVRSDHPLQLTKASLAAYFMHSDVQPIGDFECSDPVVNKIWKATNNSYLSNLFGYPTDCPQREKNGWTGDAHIASETGLYNFDGITIYEKWLADHRDEQQPNGVLPSIVPSDGWGYEWGNGPDWTSTIAIIPWNIYLFYGDPTLLADCYDNIKRYVDHITDRSPSGLTDWGLGDWVPVKSKSPVELTSTAYYYTDALILSRAAAVLGHTKDQQHYSALAEKIRNAFNAKYLDPATGIYGAGLQTELSVALYWGLVPPELKAKVAANLARRVAADGNQLDVGLLGTKAILNALSENGYAGLAYTLASRQSFPSWGWWIVNGATTLYENWPIDAKSDISMNHIMFGEIGAWLYKGLAGILPDPDHPGFRHILLRPHVVKGLDHVQATHDGPYGRIVSAWTQSGGHGSYSVTVPPNSTATVRLEGITIAVPPPGITRRPGTSEPEYLVPAGSYRFEW